MQSGPSRNQRHEGNSRLLKENGYNELGTAGIGRSCSYNLIHTTNKVTR